MNKPCIICVAITGSVATKSDNPAVPITITEQVESTHAAFEVGASIAHCHVRSDDGTPSSDPERFARLMDGISKHCPGMIIHLSTVGRSGAGLERGVMLCLRPDMASLTVGSNNFPTRVYENPPDVVDWLARKMYEHEIKPEIEAFDLSHIHHAALMRRDGRLSGHVYVQFVMGIKNAMPTDKDVFDYYIKTVERLLPDVDWCAAGFGANQIIVYVWCVALGGHARTGLEDNVRLDKHTLATSNATLVQRVVDLCDKYERPVATWSQAREILELRSK